MPLSKPQPSKRTMQAFRNGIAELVDMGRAPGDLRPEGYPYEIYVLTLGQAAKGSKLGDSKAVAWELLLESASGLPVAAAVGHPPAGRTPRMTSLARGPLIARLLAATAQIENLPEVQVRDYELRRLFIGGLSVRAFWLKALAGSEDLIVPYNAVITEFVRMKPYASGEFMRVIGKLARKRLKFNDRPRSRKK
ncbi:MAG TPA: hypothetical protein VKX49_12135 [Bryobacteraceae bacterium]|nr:hypothetical protein [Bryobacteraceae bacterium]